jgi:hypothetical protein
MQLLHSQIEILALCSGALFPQRRFLENLKSLSQPFMEHEDSLPYTQQYATDPYPEADESSSQPPTSSIKIHFNIIRLRLGLPRGIFPLEFTIKIWYAFLVCLMLPTCPVHLALLHRKNFIEFILCVFSTR